MRRILAGLLVIASLTALFAQLRGGNKWAKYEWEMQDPVDDPADAHLPGEFVLGRLRYRSPRDGRGPYYRWGIDANKGDRIFLDTLRRLTRIHVQSIENIVDVDADDLFETPFVFAVSPGDWQLTPAHAGRLRKFFDRGGFLLVDDFHGPRDWAQFMAGVEQIYPNPNIVELGDNEAIFHVIYDLKERINVPGANVVHGPGYEKDGTEPFWRALLDEQGRMVMAICFNMDVGDGWEFADDPQYPEKFSAMALRLGVNYAAYAMTH
jgi:hypothetical protein